MRTISAGVRAQVRADRVLRPCSVARSSCLSVSGSARDLRPARRPPRRRRSRPRRASRGRTPSARRGRRAGRGRRVVERELLLPRPGLDLGGEHHRARRPALVARPPPRPRPPSGSRAAARAPRRGGRAGPPCGRGSARPSRSPAGKPRSSITAAIGIETFIVSGLPQASAAASRKRARERDVRRRSRRARRRARGSARRAGRAAGGPGGRSPAAARRRRGPPAAISPATAAGSSPAATRACASSSSRAHASAVPRITGPQPRIPAATAPCSDPGSAASVIRAATFVGIIPCSAIATSSRSRKKRWSSVGSRPVSSRWKYSVKLSRPIRSPVRSRPAHLDPVGIGLADVADGAPGPRRHSGDAMDRADGCQEAYGDGVEGRAIDPDAFNAFEAASWDRQGAGIRRLLRPDHGRLAEPLLDAAGVERARGRSTWPPGRATRRAAPPSGAPRWSGSTSPPR